MPIQPSFTPFSLLTTPDFYIFLATKLSTENRYVRQHLQECEPWRCGSNFVSVKRTNQHDVGRNQQDEACCGCESEKKRGFGVDGISEPIMEFFYLQSF